MSPIYNIVILILAVQVFVAVLYYSAVHHDCGNGSPSASDNALLPLQKKLSEATALAPASSFVQNLRISKGKSGLPMLHPEKDPSSSANWKLTASAPCGDQELHDALVARVSQVESGYVTFVLGKRSARFPNREIHKTFRRALDVSSRRKSSSELSAARASVSGSSSAAAVADNRLVTVQIGCLDGRKNDPLYQSYVLGFPNSKEVEGEMTLRHWHGILVEPGFMSALKATYHNITILTDMQLQHMHFVEGAINVAEQIDDHGLCHFFKVKPPNSECPSKQRWVEQISGLDAQGLRQFFGAANFKKCVDDQAVPCWSPGALLAFNGFDLQQFQSPLTGSPVWCHKPTTGSGGEQGGYQRVDIMAVDVEGFDAQILQAAFNELCPDLWPTVLLYEDKVLRFNSATDTNSTYYGDHMIEFLEQRGYYVMLLKEDVLALRIGYKVPDLRHTDRNTLYQNAGKFPDYAKWERTKWIHPKSYNYLPGMPEPSNRNMKIRKADMLIPR